ncbi:MAG TPA: hypothetical protein VF765_01745 [Polyangiaceae bacterium]
MPGRRSTLTATLCATVLACTAGPAFAQSDADRATARQLGQDGEDALAAKDYKRAEDDFRRADTLIHAPTLILGLARAYAGEGKFLDAQEAYQRIIREGVAPAAPDAFKKALDAAKTEVQDVSPKIGGVTITVKAAGGGDVPNVKVTIDDAPVSAAALGVKRAANPGPHVVNASADGFKPATLNVTVPIGGAVDAPLTLEKDLSAPAPVPQATPADANAPGQQPPTPEQAPASSGGHSILPWIAFGVGGVGLGLGAVTGILAIGKHSDLSKSCNPNCGPDQQSNLDSYHTLGTLSTVGFIVAGVGAAAGVTLLILQPKASADASPATPAARLVVGPGSIGALGTF